MTKGRPLRCVDDAEMPLKRRRSIEADQRASFGNGFVSSVLERWVVFHRHRRGRCVCGIKARGMLLGIASYIPLLYSSTSSTPPIHSRAKMYFPTFLVAAIAALGVSAASVAERGYHHGGAPVFHDVWVSDAKGDLMFNPPTIVSCHRYQS